MGGRIAARWRVKIAAVFAAASPAFAQPSPPASVLALRTGSSASLRDGVEVALRRRMEEAPPGLGVEDRLELVDALGRLSAREREALRLTYWDGLSAAEVGEVLGSSASAIWTLLTRARAKLQDSLERTPAKGGVR